MKLRFNAFVSSIFEKADTHSGLNCNIEQFKLTQARSAKRSLGPIKDRVVYGGRLTIWWQ